MTLADQVYAQALLLAGPVETAQSQALEQLCAGVTAALTQRLRVGITPEDCKADFIAAGSLYALAMLSCAGVCGDAVEMKAGDLSFRRRDGDAAANALRSQAELIIAPYLQDRVAFLGV